jgi:26S proteasome regulatory subunit N9
MASKGVTFLEDLQAKQPDLANDLSELIALYNKKLWYQITVKLEECFQQPAFNRGDLPLQLYHSFIADFGAKLNLLKLAQFAVHVSKFYPDATSSVSFLEGVVQRLQDLKDPQAAQPALFLKMHIAQHKLDMSDLPACKKMIEDGRETLDTLADVDPSVSAAVYYVSSLFNKCKQDYAEFYKSSLMYLAFVSSESLATDFKLTLAVDISLAALLGEHVYNFGELLIHPIVKTLDDTPYHWLHELLQCFNQGDLQQYDTICNKYSSALNGQPGLVKNVRSLKEKITIMSLLELISSLPADNRKISLQKIAARTKLDTDGVEFLLMKALSLHLIEGSIDGVDEHVQVTWVQPRVLTKPEIEGLKSRLDSWLDKVTATSLKLEHESIGVVE